MRRLAEICTNNRKKVLLGWILIVVAAALIAGGKGATYSSNFHLPSSDSQRALDLLQDRFPAQKTDPIQIVFSVEDGRVTEEPYKQRIETTLAEVRHVGALDPQTLVSPFTPKGAQQISRDGTIAYATINPEQETIDLKKAEIEPVIETAQQGAGDGLDVELGGQPILVGEQQDGGGTEAIGLLAAIVVLMITFGSVVAMGLPVLTALLALGTAISLLTLSTHIFDIPDFAPQLATMIGLGVGIDYALFIVTRYRTGLQEGLDPHEAVLQSVDTSGRAVLFAGITVIVALLGMLLLGIDFLYGVAVGASVAVLMTMIASLTLLPALLAMVGRRIDRLRLPGLGRQKPPEESRWFAWSRMIQRHPWAAAILCGGFLLLLCLPALSLRLGSSDAGSNSADKTSRKAYDLLAEGFGPGFNGPFQVVVDLPHTGDAGAAQAVTAALNETEGIVVATRPILNEERNTAVVVAYPTTSPQAAETTSLLHRVRDDVIPPLEEKTGASVYVGGSTAVYEDFGDALSEKLPLFIGVVVLLSALLLMAVFRSVLVPIKAVLMNLISIGAAFGIVVAIFQWGWGSELIGVDRTGPIESFLPVMVFAIVFGLSMDYEVFLLSRVHEEWERTGDASEAVTRGLALTGRVITAAAAIMVTVFLSFVLLDDRVIKLFGIGLAVAVLIDAVLIRTILVPAIMQLLGARAWWLPAWLDRLLPRISVEPAQK